jgi:hypothetical protein
LAEKCRKAVEKEKLISRFALKTEQNVCEVYVNATGCLDTIFKDQIVLGISHIRATCIAHSILSDSTVWSARIFQSNLI